MYGIPYHPFWHCPNKRLYCLMFTLQPIAFVTSSWNPLEQDWSSSLLLLPVTCFFFLMFITCADLWISPPRSHLWCVYPGWSSIACNIWFFSLSLKTPFSTVYRKLGPLLIFFCLLWYLAASYFLTDYSSICASSHRFLILLWPRLELWRVGGEPGIWVFCSVSGQQSVHFTV